MITGSLCKAARALVGISRFKLAANSKVDTRAVELFERGISTPDDTAIAALEQASPTVRLELEATRAARP